MKKKLLLSLTLLLFLLKTTDAYSQPKAVPDNVFVAPNARNVIWNVLFNDDPDNCTYDKLNMTITVPPLHAQTYGVNAANRITYRPVANFIGRDSLTYQIQCGAQTSSAKVYINVNDKPDFMYMDVCHVPPPTIGFAMRELSRTPQNSVYTVSPIVCGDIDNDGEVEILVCSTTDYTLGNTLNIRNIDIYGVRKSDTQLYLKYTLNDNNNAFAYEPGSIVIASVDGDGYAAIFCVQQSSNTSTGATTGIIKFRFNPNTGRYERQWIKGVNSAGRRYSLVIADFAGDGNVQIQAGDQIYNAKTGALLVSSINANGLGTPSYGLYGHEMTTSARPTESPVLTSFIAGDIDDDGKPELVAGDCVYKVNITNHSGTLGNSFTLLRRLSGRGYSEINSSYGGTTLADIDGDGRLEAIVVAWQVNSGRINTLYAYRPQTGAVISWSGATTTADLLNFNGSSIYSGVSRPIVGDIDGDGKPEIIVLSARMLSVIKYYPRNSKPFQIYRTMSTGDTSGSTTLTAFDFTQSGASQLVYRDEDQLRIINGATLGNLATVYSVYSPTINEYPVVADVNGDGAAEIITVGANTKYISTPDGDIWNHLASLRIYGASGTNKWAPARKVWNSGTYNPVYVNDDLTIPRYPLNPATKFTEANGTVHQPFNNFMQQATLLNDEGRDLWLGADLAFDRSRKPQMSYDFGSGTTNVTFDIFVNNVGDRAFPSPLRIGLYGYNSASDLYIKLNVQNITLSAPIEPGETRTVSFSVPDYENLVTSVPAFNQLYICINAIDNAGAVGSAGPEPVYYFNTVECQFHNNMMLTSMVYGERVMCEGTTEAVNVSIVSGSNYLYRWYEIGNPDPFYEGDTYNVTKDNTVLQRYLINTYTHDGLIKLNIDPDTVNIYLFPDTLIWTGAAYNNDWHEPNNWIDPTSSLYPQRNIPRKCTNVLIPEGLEYYPDLTGRTSEEGPETNYTTYSKSECANITFEHSARVVRTDLLDYDRAFVQLRLAGNRNYMLSAPLQHFYTGDYYVKDRNPVQDDIIAYTSLFSRSNPQTSSYVEGAWTGLFNNPDYLFGAGSGIRLWADDKQPDANIHTNVTFLFPKHDPVHSIFNKTSGAVVSNYPVARGNEHRFIYEPKLNVPSGDIPMDSVYAKRANVKVLVGNPFMAYLDFDLFYQKNRTKIKPTYQLIMQDGSTVTYDASTGTGTDPTLNKYIAPMQSFWVESLIAFSDLYADVTMTSLFGTETLRSAGIPSFNDESMLTIELSGNGTGNRTLLICSPEASNRYNDDGEDATKIFMAAYPEAVSVYTRSSDGYYLDIDRIGDLNEIVPVGIHTLLKGSYRLNFDGVWNFPADTHIWLNERRSDGSVFRLNLSAGCHYYDFEKTDDKIYENDRFYLSFEPSATGLQTPEAPDRKIIGLTSNDGSFKIFTSDGSPLTRIELFDLQGRKLQSLNPERSEYILHPASSGIYIVRAQSTTASRSFKIYAK